MKIFAAGIATETNVFSPDLTGLEDFQIQRGVDSAMGRVVHRTLDLSLTWGEQAAERGAAFTFSLMAWAKPGGVTIRSAYESLREEILRDLRVAMPVDVVLLNLHGAMIAQGYDDCEEDLIRRVRAIVGPTAIIAVELDLHCHLHAAKIALADIVITYKEYPHVDMNERARELFELALAARLGYVRPRMALFDCRMVGLYPTSREPLRGFVDAMMAGEKRAGVLSISFGHGFPFADLPHVGAKVLAIADGDAALAELVAREFGSRVYDMRREIGFDSLSLPLEQALATAVARSKGPIVIADQSDNPGGGAPGDSTHALRWLLDHNVSNAAVAILYEPEVVRLARKAGSGSTLSLRIGGKMGALSGAPVDLDATVGRMLDSYMLTLHQQSGEPAQYPAGDVVALHCGSIDIVVSSVACQCFTPSIFSDLGIDPSRKHLLVVKSAQHFHSAFAPVAAEVIYMAAPGAVAPDPRQVPYRRLKFQGMYPWDPDPLGRDVRKLGSHDERA